MSDTLTSNSIDDFRSRGVVQWLKYARAKFGGEALFVAATMSQPVVNLVSAFVAAKSLTPFELGTINAAALFPAYLGFLQLGVFTGLSRNLPIAIGAGDSDHADRLERVSAAVATYVGALAGAICLTVAILALWRGDSLFFWAMSCIALTSALGPPTTHVDTVLRARLQFGPAAWSQITSNLFMLVANVVVTVYGVIGSLWRIATGGLFALLARLQFHSWRPTRINDWRSIVDLGRIGMPLLLSGTLFSILNVADRSVVALLLGNESLGYFSLAGMIVNSLQFIPQAFAMILFPLMAQEFGRTQSPRSLRRFIILNLALNVATIIPVCLALYLSLDWLVKTHFPAYEPGLPAARVACLTGTLWIYLGVGSVFGVMNKMKGYLIVMSLAIALVWIGSVIAIRLGFGIVGAAYARLAGTFVVSAFTICHAFVLVHRAPSNDQKLNQA